MTRTVVEKEAIPEKDIIYLTDRGYTNKYMDSSIQIFDFSFYIMWFYRMSILKLLSMSYHTKIVDKVLQHIVDGEKFIIYVPQMSIPLFQVMVSHKLCMEYNFIEEGLADYRKNLWYESTNSYSAFLTLIFKFYNSFHSRFQLLHPFLAPYRKSKIIPTYYLLDNKWHEPKEHYCLVQWPIEKIDFNLPEESVVIVMSPLVENNLSEKTNFIKSVHYLIDKSCEMSKGKPIYLKFHPYQSTDIINIILTSIKRYDVRYILIPNEEPFEQLIMHTKNLKLLGYESSLLFYATFLGEGHKVYSMSDCLAKIDSLYKSYVGKIDNHLHSEYIKL